MLDELKYPNKPPSQSCSTCIYLSSQTLLDNHTNKVALSLYFCCKHAPICEFKYNSYGQRPSIKLTDWCGDYEEKT